MSGHPDDPESGCGGTLTRLVKAGDEVTIVYLTKGGQVFLENHVRSTDQA